MSVLNAEPRSTDAKETLKQLRRRGVLPMAIIEKGKGTVPVQANEKEVRAILHEAHRQFQIKVAGETKPRDVILTKVEKDALAAYIIHVSVMQVAGTDVVTMDVPIVLAGTPDPVARHEASLLHPTAALKIRGQVKDIPENIELDVSGLDVGGSISAGEVPLPLGLECLTPGDATIVTVKVLRTVELEEAPAEAEGVEPELVGKEGAEEEEQP